MVEPSLEEEILLNPLEEQVDGNIGQRQSIYKRIKRIKKNKNISRYCDWLMAFMLIASVVATIVLLIIYRS